jgi:hypothetical protein
MLLTHYNTESSLSSWFYKLRIVTLARLRRVAGWFKLKNLRTGLINRVANQVEKMYLISEGLKKIIYEHDLSKTPALIKLHAKVQINLKRVVSYHSLLEKANFFDQKEIKEFSELALLNFCKVEARIRQAAYPEKHGNCEDENLQEFITNLSLGSLPA